MKTTAVMEGDKVSIPCHSIGVNSSFWTGGEAPADGVIISLDGEHEQISGGVFIPLDNLKYLVGLLERMKRHSTKESNNDDNKPER
jgi:hypothetical protein